MSGITIWFTGYSGAGKTTLAKRLSKDLLDLGFNVELLDGDEIRNEVGSLGFDRDSRIQYLKFMALMAKKLEKHGVVTIGSFITPYEEARAFLRNNIKNYFEIWLNTSLVECEKRDVKGLYKKARKGEVKVFTGISDVYEEPKMFDLKLDTEELSEKQCLERIYQGLKEKFPHRKFPSSVRE